MAGVGGGETGKLTWAGEAWATGRHRPSDLTDDAEKWGLDPALFDAPEEDGLWEIHAHALNAFLAISTQWRMAHGVIGLDYAGARAGLRMAGLKVSPEVWAEIQVIEAGAIKALNRKM